VNTLLVACLVVGFYFLFCDPAQAAGTKGNWTYCFNNVPQSIFLFLSSLVSFFLGFFINQTFSRWWQIRSYVGTVTGKASNVINLLRIYMPDDDKEAEGFRVLARRYCMLALMLSKKTFNNDKNFQDLIDQELLLPEEAEIITPLNLTMRYSIIFLWLSILLRNAALSGKMMEATTVLRILNDNVTEMRGACGGIGSHLSQQISFNYVHILTVIVKLHILLVTIYSAGIISLGRYTYSYSTIIFGILLAIVNQFIYDGLLMIHAELVNPLGDDPNDFPIEQMTASMGTTLAALSNPANVPPELMIYRYDPEKNRQRKSAQFDE
jgi:predicted membrane chloride channel (bestrophin family)